MNLNYIIWIYVLNIPPLSYSQEYSLNLLLVSINDYISDPFMDIYFFNVNGLQETVSVISSDSVLYAKMAMPNL